MRKAYLAASVVSPMLLLATANVAQAQATDGSQATVEDRAPAPGGDEIIVTARKRDERLQDVPAAIAAVGGAEIQRYSTSNITQISSRVPQLQVGNVAGPGGGSINLRGIGSPGTSPSVDQAVSINIDGIQISQGNAISLGILDLDRVEVLKGPQALFYGKNSLGGIISLISADPGKDMEWRGRAGYDFASRRQQYEAMVSVPLTDSLGVRVVGSFADQDGFFRNGLRTIPGGSARSSDRGPEGQEYFVRGTLKFDSPDGIFDARLKVAYAKTDRETSLGAGSQLISCPLGRPQLQVFAGNTTGIGDCTFDNTMVDPQVSATTAAARPYYFEDGLSFFKQSQFLSSLTMNIRPAENLTLTSVTGYYNFKERWSWNVSAGEIENLVTAARVSDRQLTQELRLATSFDSPLNVVVGGFLQDSEKFFAAPLILTGVLSGFSGPLVLTDDRFTQKTEAYSVFGQGILTLSPELEITGGGRFSFETKRLRAQRFTSVLSGFSPTPVQLNFTPSKVSFDDFSPEATVRYRPTPNVTLYAAYREGFTSGGFNTAPATPAGDVTYRQARARGYEAGVKGSALDRQLTFDAAVYTYDYNDLQLNAFDPVSISVKVRNAATARTRGAELALSFSPRAVSGLTLRSNVAYNHGRYRTYADASCYAGQSIAQGCNRNLVPRFDPNTGAPLPASFSSQDLSGTQLERSPDWTMSHGFSFETPVGSAIKIGFGGDAAYTSSFNSEAAHNPRAFQRDAWRFNGLVSIGAQNDSWSLSLIGRNLTNTLRAMTSFEYPLTGASFPGYATPGLGADVMGAPSEPRAVMLQLTVKNSIFN